jgi:hypothetical protein
LGLSSPAIFLTGIIIDVLTFVCFFLLSDTYRYFDVIKKAVLWSVAINTVIAVVFFIVNNIFQLNIGTIFYAGQSSYIRNSGLYAEPDIFGFYTSSIAVLLFPLLKRVDLLRLRITTVCFWLCTVINILTLTRTTLLSEIACIMFYFLINKKFGKLMFVFAVIGIVYSAGTIFHENQLIGRFGGRSTQTDNGAFNSRVYSIMLNIAEIRKSFLFGSGPGYLYDLVKKDEIIKMLGTKGDININRNGTVFFLGEIFNTGALGLLMVLSFFLFIWRTLSIPHNNGRTSEIASFVDGVKLLFLNALIVSISNTVIKMVFIWVFVGIGCKIAVQIKQDINRTEITAVHY